MESNEGSIPGRRAFLRACLAMPASLVLAACAGGNAQPTADAVVPTDQPAAPTSAPTRASVAQAQPTTPPTEAPTAVPTSAPTEAVPTAAVAEAPTSAPTEAAPSAVAAMPPTPACADDDELTPAQTEGPYFTPNSPERSSLLEPGMAGTRMLLSGVVLTTACQPVAQALIDVWHADDAGVYDNQGYKLRGHLFSDDQGRFSLETIVPGLYPGRTRHFHVKVQAPNQPVLTTQLYFPGEPDNARDGIYQPELELAVQDAADGKAGSFTFVLAVA